MPCCSERASARTRSPGTWRGRHGVCVDLMVVPHQSGRTGRSARAARLPPHQKGIARIARGLEPALVDHTVMSVGALDDRDGRAFDVRVAGPSALLVAKLIKIGERLQMAGTGGRSRVQAKDALDLLRLLRATRTSDLVEGLERHRADRYAAEVSVEALSLLRQHGVRATAALPRLASESVGGDPTTSASFVALAGQLLSSVPQPEGK